MNYLAVSKFDKHQHYRNRNPIWVKYYVSLLDIKHPLNELPIPTRYLFDRLLLLAAKYENAIPNDSELIAKLLCMDSRECREGLDQLLKGRWIKTTNSKRRASKPASGLARDLSPPETDTERERTRAHARTNGALREPLPHKYPCPYDGCTVAAKTADDLQAHCENTHGAPRIPEPILEDVTA